MKLALDETEQRWKYGLYCFLSIVGFSKATKMVGIYVGRLTLKCENGEVATSYCVVHLKLSESLSSHLINQDNNTHGLLKIRLYRACKRAWPIVVKVLVAQLCLNLCDPTDCSPPGSSGLWYSPGKNTEVGCHFLLQGSSWLRDQTQVSCTAGRFITIWATREALTVVCIGQINLGSLSLTDHPVLWRSIC